jgi:uncharacterized repeat protein (TIGR04076 family)
MAKFHDVKVTLISQSRKCHRGHRVGDEWIVGGVTPAGICLGAFSSLLPYITVLRFGGDFPWETQDGEGTFACPDHLVCNVFHLQRLGRESS